MVADGYCRGGADILSHDVSFLQADGEGELFACLCEAGDKSFKSILRLSSESGVVCKEHHTDEPSVHLWLGSE